MISPRASVASGVAGAAGAALLLSGRLDGSVIVAVVLLIAARAAAAASCDEPAAAQHSFARQAAFVPAWIGVASVGMLRAGSLGLADVRGANAVAGLAIARGEPATVAAVWFALLAGAVALGGSGMLVTTGSARILEALAILGQAVLLIELFAGPQLNGARDLLPWTVGAVGAALVVRFVPERARSAWTPRAAGALAVVAVGLVVVGGAA